MSRIIYRATDSGGKTVTGYVQGRSNREAIDSLKAEGFSDIELHCDALAGMERPDLEQHNENELEAIARFELETRRGGGVSVFLREVVRVNKWGIIIGVLLAGIGAYRGSAGLFAIGGGIALAPNAISLWNYRVPVWYNRLLKAAARGEWDKARKLTGKLHPRMPQQDMVFDLDARLATIEAYEGDLDKALSIMAGWSSWYEMTSPGIFLSRLASVYYAAGEYDAYLAKVREAWKAEPESAMMALDLALAEARVGDVEVARQLLRDAVEPEELSMEIAPYVDWARGMIARRRGETDAPRYFAAALQGVQPMVSNPAAWALMALCSGGYADALAATGCKDQAEEVLRSVWPVLRVHGDKPLLDRLRAQLPGNDIMRST